MFRWTMDETTPQGEVIDHAQTQSMNIGDDLSTSTDRATTPAEAGWIPLPYRDHAQHLTLPAPVHLQELAAGDEQLHLRLGRAAENDDGRNALVDLQRAPAGGASFRGLRLCWLRIRHSGLALRASSVPGGGRPRGGTGRHRRV